MFRDIVSRLSFSPALVGQLSFYAKRLRQEQFTRRLGLIFTVLALLVQSLAVFQAPEPANAASSSDFVYGGVKDVNQFLSLYDKNSGNLKDIFNSFGITRSEIASTKHELFTVGKKVTWGRIPKSADIGSRKIYNAQGSHVDTVYGRNMSKLYKRGEAGRDYGLIGYSKSVGWFAITLNCANLVTDVFPPPPPEPKDINVCRLSDKKIITIKENEFNSSQHSKDLADCVKDIKVCRLSDFSIITIKENALNPALHSTDLNNCKPPEPTKIQVCLVKTYEIITIEESEFNKDIHSKDINDCNPPATPGKLELSKKANNTTQGKADATTAVAQANDRIIYTLSIENTGGSAIEATFVDNLTDSLEYSSLIDNGGGTFNEEAKTLSWPTITLEAGATEYRTYTVKLLSEIPSTPIGVSDRTSYDCQMDNVFGNAIAINVQCPEPKIIENVVQELPKTGPGENMTFAAIVFAVVTYFYYRSKQLNKEVRLIRRNLNTGAL